MSEQDELGLTRKEVISILKKHHRDGILDFMGFTEEILAKAKQQSEFRWRERISIINGVLPLLALFGKEIEEAAKKKDDRAKR